MSIRLAVSTEDFETSLRTAISRAAAAQVDGIRLNARRDVLAEKMSATGMRQLNQYVRENRMQIAGLMCPTRHHLAAPEFLTERIQLIRSAMDLARPLQTSSLLVPCGRIPDPNRDPDLSKSADLSIHESANPFSFGKKMPVAGRTSAEEFNTLCEVVSDLARHGNHVGCILTLQLTNYDVPLIQQLSNSVKTGPIQIAFDPAVAAFSGANPVDKYRDLYQLTGYLRLRDGIRNADMAGTETAIGDGIVNWEEFLPTLVEANFTGWACVERTGGDQRESDVLQGVDRIRALLPVAPHG